jgi:hypothetical protein
LVKTKKDIKDGLVVPIMLGGKALHLEAIKGGVI